jgi:aryl carrier-like protein
MTTEHDAEQVVAAIWTKLLAQEAEPDEESNFLEDGGDSLRVARLAEEVSAATGATIPLRVFFRSPTFGTLMDCVRGKYR